jgi:hypothetical protein
LKKNKQKKMIVSEIKLYELLKAKIGEKEAEAFVQILETKVDQKFEDAKQTLVIKEDLLKLQLEIEKRFNQLIIWVVGTGIAVAGLVLAIVKL